MSDLAQLIQAKIQANPEHCISFSEFMQLALYSENGYYTVGNPLGSQGDFITSPEISPLFARCLANQCAEVLSEISEPAILEFGAGTGRLACDLLKTLQAKNTLPALYQILETSPSLRTLQKKLIQETLPHLVERVEWINALPPNFKGIMLANEVMDAFPVHCFRWDGETRGFIERAVTYDERSHTFQWIDKKITTGSALDRALSSLPHQDFAEGYFSEINLMLPKWINAISESLSQGLVLLFDYGYSAQEFYHPARTEGTLMCYYQHRSHTDPFAHVGEQDITAHVNFSEVAESAKAAGLDIAGYVSQANFLLSCDLLGAFEEEKKNKDAFAHLTLQQALRRLIEPYEMGESIKCIGLTRALPLSLMGFQKADRLTLL